MTTYQTSIVAGVFRDSGPAQQAVEALRNAGFKYDQVGVAARNAPNATPSLHDDLMKLGVSDDVASFYEREYQAGRIVVSIRPDGRDDNARDILRQYGAYDYSVTMGTQAAQPEQQGQPTPENRPDAARARGVEGPTQYGQSEQPKRPDEYQQGWNPVISNQPPRENQPPASS